MSQAHTALVIGVGGLGCPIALGLAEAGVGRLVLVDPDTVEASNLHRQVLYTRADLGRLKVEAAAERLESRAPHTTVTPHAIRLTPDNATRLIAEISPTVILDATDDPAARFTLNDAALALGIPAVLGGVIRFEGLVMAVRSGAPCFRCLFETAPDPGELPTCASAGVLGAMAGLVGHLQVARALTLLGPTPEAATGFITTVDGLRGRVRDVPVPRDPQCAGCRATYGRSQKEGESLSVNIKLPSALRKFTGGHDTVAVTSANVREALDQLDANHPGIKAKLCDGDGNLRRFVNVYANQEDIRFLDNLDTTLGNGAELQIVSAITGAL